MAKRLLVEEATFEKFQAFAESFGSVTEALDALLDQPKNTEAGPHAISLDDWRARMKVKNGTD